MNYILKWDKRSRYCKMCQDFEKTEQNYPFIGYCYSMWTNVFKISTVGKLSVVPKYCPYEKWVTETVKNGQRREEEWECSMFQNRIYIVCLTKWNMIPFTSFFTRSSFRKVWYRRHHQIEFLSFYILKNRQILSFLGHITE